MAKNKPTVDFISKAAKARIKSFEKEAERIVAAMSKLRDELDDLVQKYSDILESVGDGMDLASNSLLDFEHAIDRMSEAL
jgi:predicted nuclease with TOPRIM domain